MALWLGSKRGTEVDTDARVGDQMQQRIEAYLTCLPSTLSTEFWSHDQAEMEWMFRPDMYAEV